MTYEDFQRLMDERRSNYERVKARLAKAGRPGASWEECLDGITTEAIRLGARAPDPREELTNYVADMAGAHRAGNVGTDRYFAEKIVSFILANAPKEG